MRTSFENESDFTRYLCKCLERVNVMSRAIVASRMQPSGLPDRWFAWAQMPGLWLEIKYEKGRLREIQRQTLLDMLERNVPCGLLRAVPLYASAELQLSFEVPLRSVARPRVVDEITLCGTRSDVEFAVRLRSWLEAVVGELHVKRA